MGCPVSLSNVARTATVPISKLSFAYNLIIKATGTVPPKLCNSDGYLYRYQDVTEHLLLDVNGSWRYSTYVRAIACVMLRVVENLWIHQGHNLALHFAAVMMFAVAHEKLAAVVLKFSNWYRKLPLWTSTSVL